MHTLRLIKVHIWLQHDHLQSAAEIGTTQRINKKKRNRCKTCGSSEKRHRMLRKNQQWGRFRWRRDKGFHRANYDAVTDSATERFDWKIQNENGRSWSWDQ